MSPREITIEWQGITLLLEYQPKGRLPVHHIAIHVIAPVGAIIPLTHTGYRSHHTYDDVESHGGPAEYVVAWLDEAAMSPDWKGRAEAVQQLSLF